MGIKAVRVGLVEALLTNGLELQAAHHGVEEDLQEIHVIPVGLLHDLDPLNGDRVVHTVMFGGVNWKFGHLLE